MSDWIDIFLDEQWESLKQKTSWLDSFREETERIRLETEEIKKETERLREENRKLRALSPEKLEKIVKKSTIMTEPDYKQILKNQDLISNLSLEEVENLERLIFERKTTLKGKKPDWHILDNPDNIKVSKRKVVDDLVPRVEYTISVNQEAVTDHKNLWRKWYIDNDYRTEENVDVYMDGLIRRWMEEKLDEIVKNSTVDRLVINTTDNVGLPTYPNSILDVKGSLNSEDT